ncbi:MAG TPA: Tm-1-like ATP-binding domain-containing protein [Candidatus Methylomirabilis sp.]|nr:Tm-1-like ATP-binding domain-containing protein [Candidatus Methylomirabilis sp.]
MAIGLLGTLDTKGGEVAFLTRCLGERGRSALVVDVGLFEPQGITPDISRHEVAAAGGADVATLIRRPRDEVMASMGRGAGEILRRLHAAGRLEGVLGLGGNQGTSVVCAGMRQLPLGFPKLVVSTVASGYVRPYIGWSDIAMLFSVADLLGGPNPVIESVLRNAAAAMAGMTADPGALAPPGAAPLVAITALGNTHPAVTRAMEILRAAGFQVAAFHASGACGTAMERLIGAGRVAAVLELTPHEFTEEVVGAGWYRPVEAGRLAAAGEMGIPQVVAPGGMEYMCFGPRESIPPRFRLRPTYFHNPLNANVRTSRREMAVVGRALAERLNQAKGPVDVVLPEKGWSIYGAPGGPLHDAAADAAFVRSLTRGLRRDIAVHRLPLHINDPAFAERCCDLLRRSLAPKLTLPNL